MSARFLIEVPHDATPVACVRAIEAILTTGSHFLTRADWGCKDGAHKCWIIVEVEGKEQARAIVPPAFRSQATVVQLNSFSLEDVEGMMKQHNL